MSLSRRSSNLIEESPNNPENTNENVEVKRKKTKRELMGQEEWLRFRLFQKNMTKFICTTRFNNETWEENVNYRNTHKTITCIYGSPTTLKTCIPDQAIVFVLEMNNVQNRIMGVGLIRNHPICGKHRIYVNGNYNRYAYIGSIRIPRENMNSNEEEIMKAFDIFCFKGDKHMKRGNGITCFPAEILFRCMNVVNLVEFISNMFKRRMMT
jgi:hypothetical protein